MKKISLKATVAAVSLSLALTPLGFAQSTAPTQAPVATQSTAANTQPLPGAKIAAGDVFVGATTAQLVIGAIIIIAGVAFAVSESNRGDDFVFLTPTSTR